MPATIFSGAKVRALKSTLSLNNGADVISSTVDPSAVATSANAGSLLLNTSSGLLYRKTDNGSTTNWEEVQTGSTLAPVRNKILNSGFDYFQRGGISGTVALTATSTYLAPDRYKLREVGTGTATVQRNVDSPNSLTKYCAQFITNYGSSADNVGVEIVQRIESNTIRDLTSTSASLGFWYNATADAPTEVNIELFTANAEDNFSALTSISSSRVVLTADGTWRQATFNNISMPADTGDGVEVRLTFDNVGTVSTNGTLKVAQLMLGGGSTAPTYNYLGETTYDEFSLCQRYFSKSYEAETSPGSNTAVGISTATGRTGSGASIDLVMLRPLPEVMRATPTVTIYSKAGTIDTVSDWAFTNVGATPHTAQDIANNAFSRITANTGTPFSNPNPYSFHFVADAEL